MTLQIFANPYNPSETGFKFSNLTEFNFRQSQNTVEEFELEFIDGSEFEQNLFHSMNCNQGNIGAYFEILDAVCNEESMQVAICCLLENHVTSFDKVIQVAKDDCTVIEGNLSDYAFDFITNSYFDSNTPDVLKTYFDYEMFERDLKIERSLFECTFAGKDFVVEIN